MSIFQIDRRSIANFDGGLFVLFVLLNLIGLINLSSAAAGSGLWKVQLYWLLLGLVPFLATLVINYNVLEKWAVPLYVISLVLLLGVHVFGRKVSGAQSWYNFSFARFQPSELMKLSVILMLARLYQGHDRPQRWGLRELVGPAVVVGLPTLSIMMEPDMGTTLVLLLVSGTMILFIGVQRRLIILLALVAALSFYPAWRFGLRLHQKERILNFIYPERDPKGSGYNALQSKIAVGSGGTFGKGYKKGTQNMLRFLPVQQTDFVFSVWAEEWGFLWVFVGLGLYLLFIWEGIRIAREAKDRFGIMLAFGCSTLFFWHILINIAMVVGLFPVIGVPLPFMSYGGSNLLSFIVATGLLINVRMRKYFF